MQSKLKEKTWDKSWEKTIREKWEKENLYQFKQTASGRIFSIDTPPPYPSGIWHIGAVAHYSLIDVIARTQRMKGFNVLFPFGLDRNGINIERTIEKKFKKPLQEFDREHFNKLCKQEIDKISDEILLIAKRIGMSCDFKNYYCTDSPEYRKVTQATFIEMFKKGLIFEDMRPNNYCPHCKTSIAEAEVVYFERTTTLNYIKWKVRETGETIVIATTRPELICACGAVLVNPNDERYKHLHGKHAKLPGFDREVEIIAHPQADPEFGSGILMECSYGDYDDIRLFRELKLKPYISINTEGRMTKVAGKYEGLTVEEARKKIIEDFKKQGLIEKQETITSRAPFCERSKTPIEFVSMKEWYVKQLDVKDELKKIADQMKFHPDKHKQILLNWIDSITIDWPISRRRYYHTEIPLWYCKKCGKVMIPKPGKYYQPWKDKAPFEKCTACGSKEFIGEERVFDTWMDSSISNLFICGYGSDEKLFSKAFPCGIRPQGREIVRTWLYYTMLKSKLLLNKKPFEHVWITGMGLDEHGKKMSKSIGNIINPIPLLEKHGADAFRFWAASEVNVGSDFRISESKIRDAGKFLTKLWNVARFISSFPIVDKKPKLTALDKWILFELNNLIKECNAGYDDFNFYIPSNKIRNFVWNVFAPHYLEMAKRRAYNNDDAALFTLHKCLKAVLNLLAPIIPFMTDYIYRAVYGKTIHKEQFPEKMKIKKLDFETEDLISLNSEIWKTKKDNGLSLKDEIKELTVPEKFKSIATDLVKTHNVKNLKFGKKIQILI